MDVVIVILRIDKQGIGLTRHESDRFQKSIASMCDGIAIEKESIAEGMALIALIDFDADGVAGNYGIGQVKRISWKFRKVINSLFWIQSLVSERGVYDPGAIGYRIGIVDVNLSAIATIIGGAGNIPRQNTVEQVQGFPSPGEVKVNPSPIAVAFQNGLVFKELCCSYQQFSLAGVNTPASALFT